ncbi:hypothetical protein EIN_318940 [Entamoeba invadens IP1]|uniref:Uncharacterized protein n=1 Tax=Entamoeba invadens IP1 TaxID=370355 RepID=A0A0A1TZI9_ENTIV|nr:hypothetical protein EIN_318940 [Entamoeba invadens IP1]ELP87015.1 hypothetical protein EIN_318940 [Entamoeba invadens IP1]|eukprot:XP_004253786.1 hypothetical protein EIN_318940 [Entamoeba invadens IP1]
MTPFVEDAIAAYINLSDDPNVQNVQELKVVDAERLVLKDKTIDEVADGQYLQLMRQIAALYPDKDAMKKKFDTFCKLQSNTGMSEEQKQFDTTYRMVNNALTNICLSGETCMAILNGITDEPPKYKITSDETMQRYQALPTDLKIIKYQQIFRSGADCVVVKSLDRLRVCREEFLSVFNELKLLSTSWKLSKEQGVFRVGMFEGINTKNIPLVYSEQFHGMIVKVPKKSYGYLEVKEMTIDEFEEKMKNTTETPIVKYTTPYTNTHFNIHLCRNNVLTQTLFDYLMLTDPNDVLDKTNTSIGILVSGYDPIVINAKLQPIQYTLSVKDCDTSFDHFTLFERQSIVEILLMQQIIAQQVRELVDEKKKEDKKAVLKTVFDFVVMKKKRRAVNKALRDNAVKYMSEMRNQIVMVKWLTRDQPIGTAVFNIIVYDKEMYRKSPECDFIKKFEGKIVGSKVEFDGHDLEYLVSEEVGTIIFRLMMKQK